MDSDINIEKKILCSWYNRLCSTELKAINAVNIILVIQEIEKILAAAYQENNRENNTGDCGSSPQ